MLTQPPLENAKIEPPQVDEQNPPPIDHPKLDDPTNPLGLTDAANRLQKLSKLVDAKRYYEAKPGLAQLRQWLVDLTEAHIGLYKVLNQLPSARAQAELEKELALQFAQLRDRTMMEMARIYISEKEYPKAIKELTEVVKSQPRSKVGLQSYELLQEIGFTEKLQLTQ
jgi:tetratricopeptide (TPR) repeat protein